MIDTSYTTTKYPAIKLDKEHATMAVGPFARLLAQLVVPVVAVLARALPAAYAQALQNARKAGVTHQEAAKSILRKTMSKSEALQVLNLSEQEATVEAIQKVSSLWIL